jgi:hypothetical protein
MFGMFLQFLKLFTHSILQVPLGKKKVAALDSTDSPFFGQAAEPLTVCIGRPKT